MYAYIEHMLCKGGLRRQGKKGRRSRLGGETGAGSRRSKFGIALEWGCERLVRVGQRMHREKEYLPDDDMKPREVLGRC
jgi:hypothetical protein